MPVYVCIYCVCVKVYLPVCGGECVLLWCLRGSKDVRKCIHLCLRMDK